MKIRALLLAVVGLSAWSASAGEQELATHAKQLVQQFAGELKPALVGAMRAGGPAQAIDVCSEQAPAIAARLSAESGWQVRRVSLRARNASTAVPDDWAEAGLKRLEQRLAEGADAEQLVLVENTPRHFRFMKAQVTEPLCLVCHGQAVSKTVRDALAARYPADQATGYGPGEIRGAFYLVRSLSGPEVIR